MLRYLRSCHFLRIIGQGLLSLALPQEPITHMVDEPGPLHKLPLLMTTWTPLIRFLVGHSFCEEEMTQYSSFINCNTIHGTSPLHFAALREDPRFVSFLLGQGLPIDSRNHFDETPLHWAVKEGHQEIVSLLISAGARVDALDSENKTPRHWALEEDQTHLLPLFPQSRKRSSLLSSPESVLAGPNTLLPPIKS